MDFWVRRLAGLFCLMLVAFTASGASAWEFSLCGKFTWDFYQFSQLGANGFFGPYDRDNSAANATLNMAARNGWLGNEITGENLVSGSDAGASYLYATLRPKIRFNEAICVDGSYRIGSWANPYPDTSLGQLNYPRYANSQGYGTERSFSPGYWNTLYATAQLPWGMLNVGKMPVLFGCGFLLDGADETTAEGVTLTAPFGPLAVGFYYYPWRRGLFVNYPILTDRNNAMSPDVGTYLRYNAGNVSAAVLCEYWNMHQGPESQLRQDAGPVGLDPLQPGRRNWRPLDATVFFGSGVVKYFDGRYFFNTEVAFWQQKMKSAPSESGLLPPQTRYWDFWGGMIEYGAVFGPVKLSSLWAYFPGYDRRGGTIIDRQPTVPAYFIDAGVSVYRPYSLLLAYNYGSGNGSKTYGSNHGFMTDAASYGFRMDYAVAANLIVYATYFTAQRVSQAYGWGWIRPNPNAADSPSVQYSQRITRQGIEDITVPADAPNILERDLGNEIGAGFDWKLLEACTLRANISYWQPGDWFKYACVDRRLPSWDTPVAANRWGIIPDRSIDAVFGAYVALEMSF